MDMLEQWRQEDQTGASPTRPNVRGAMESASDVDAQKIARSRELAGKLGLPEPLVMADLDRAERESKVKTLDSAPLLANWAAEDRMHAALAANEPEKLVELFDYTGTGIKTDAGINIDPLARSYDQGTIQVKLSQLGERYRAGDASVINDITTLREKMNPYAQQDAYGMILPGNGAQASATVLQDGGHATSVPSLIREIDGKFALLPKLSQDGRLLSDDEALQQFIQTGSHAGIFATARDALTFVRLPEGKRQGLAQSWKQKPKESWAERIGMGTAAEQIPIMMSLQIPSATEAMGMGIAVWGASTLATAGSGAAVGTVVPGPGTAIGAAGGATLGQGVAVSSGMLAAKTTYLTRVAQRSFNLERGSFIAELALEKDENGQPLPKNIQNAASDIYGVMAAAIETGGEALFLRLLKPLGIGDVAEGSAKAFIKSAVKRAVFDQSVRGKLIDIAARLGINSLSEGLEEGLQQAAQALVEYGAKGVANASGTDFENDLFSPKNFTDVIESAQKGAAAGFWLGGGPIMVSGAFQVQEAKSAQSFAKRQSEIHTLVEATQLKQLSPQHMEGALEAAGPAMQSSVQLPADAVLELFQNGTDLISPLGYTEQEVAKLADMGQQIEVPLSRLHARLDQVQFDAAASIMRQSPAGVSAAEAANTQNRIEHDAAILIEHEQQRQEQQNAFEAERERLRVDVTSAIESVPGLQVQAQTMAGSVSAYVDTLLQVWGSMARRLTPKGGDTAATLRKLVVHRLEKAQRTARSGRMPEENVSPLASLPDETLARVMSMEGIDPTYAPLDRFSPAEQQILRDAGIVETVEREGSGANELLDKLNDGGQQYFQPSQEDVLLADEALARDVEAWGKAVDAVGAAKTAPSQHVVMLNQTPLILQMIGADFLTGKRAVDGGLYVSSHTFENAITGRHGVTLDMLKQIPEAMVDPIAIFDSSSEKGKGDVVFMLELKDKQGRTVVVPVALQGAGQNRKTINIVKSAYGKGGQSPAVQWFLDQAKKNARYVNGQKYEHWQEDSGVQFSSGYANVHGNTIYTDADLVKLREANPTLYQSAYHGSPRGSVQIFPEKYLISLFKQANLSTLLHETGHIFLAELGTLIHSGAADEVMTADYQRILDWLGAKPGKKLSVRQQEQFARGFEAYLMEGKAPTRELSSAFARFKNWLLRIYREAKSLRVELTDEMRGVFDRLLATDAEIAEVATWHELLSLTEKELDALNLTGPARTYAAGLMDAAKDSASEKLRQDRDRQRRERLARYTLEARKEARADPVQQTRRAMRDTPLDLEAVREAFGQDTAEKLMRALPASLKNGGLDPEIFAAQHGFENAAAMMREVLAAPSLRDAVADLVATKEAAHDTTFNDRAADYLIETEQAAEQVELVGRYLAENQQNAHIQQESFAQAARQELTTMPMGKATQSGRFTVALRDAMRRMRQAIADGNFAAALEANHKARLNMEFARQSLDIARQQQVIQNRIKRFISMAKGDPAARFAVMDVGMRHGLAKFSPPLADNRDSSTIRTWISAAESDGYTLYVDDAVLYGPGKPWREMSVADFSSLIETVNQLVTVERNQRQVSTAQGKAELDAVAGSIAAGIYSHRRPEQTKTVERDPAAKKMLASVHAVHTKIEALCIALDGDKHGPAWEYIYKPITDAEDRQSVRFKQVRLDLNRPDLFGAYSRKELADMCRKKTFVPEVGEKLTRENRIAVALNLGNAANINRIKEGHGWTDEQIAAVVRDLDKRDWDFVQSVWDYLDTFREEAFALQESITRLRPQAVQAQPVSTPHGTYRGGYYPIRYNADKGFRAFEQEQAAMDKELFGGRNYGAAMTKNGHLKERAKLGQQSPLLLELSVITDHVFNVVHDLSYRQAVLDVAKVLRHKTVREAMESTVGKEMYRQLMPWLQDVANERQEPMHYVHKLTRWARSSTSIMQMGFKITTMLTQPIGFTQSIELLGYGYVGQGLKRVYGNPLRLPALIEETFARSPMMDGRIKGFDREVRDFTKRLQPGMGRFAWLDAIRDNAFVPMGLFQMSVDLPTWWGAYEKGIKDHGGDEILAAQYADSVVRMAQGSGATKDLARIQRGGDMARMFTMFYSYFNTFYNLAARRITALQHDRSPAAVMQAAHTALLLWFIPAVLSELVAGRGPDDDEDPAKWAGMNMLQYPFQAVVGLRDVASAVFGEYGYAITPAESAPESVVKWFKSVNKALEKEDAGLLTKPTVEAVGYLFGLPLKQPIITVGTMWDWLTGDDPDLFVRDLFFVKPKSRRQ